jgi:hypothetical protein
VAERELRRAAQSAARKPDKALNNLKAEKVQFWAKKE